MKRQPESKAQNSKNTCVAKALQSLRQVSELDPVTERLDGEKPAKDQIGVEQSSVNLGKKGSRKKRAKKVQLQRKKSLVTTSSSEPKKGCPDEEEGFRSGSERLQALPYAINAEKETVITETDPLDIAFNMQKEIIDQLLMQHSKFTPTVTNHNLDNAPSTKKAEVDAKPRQDLLFAEVPIRTPLGSSSSTQETEIRLLELLPAFMGESIICNMHRVILQKKPAFVGLSYPWGGDKMTSSIRVRGYNIPVTSNLHNALLDLRKPNESLTLWVDAICINQADMDEKCYQVSQMPRIYNTAQGIMAWIGGESTESDELMDWVTLTPKEIQKKEISQLKRIHDIFSRPYWTRIWMAQELAAANRIRKPCTLYCGKRSVTLDQFKAFLETMLRLMKESPLRTITQPKALLSLSTMNPKRTFLDILWQSSTLKASKDVDRIYAIRGISEKFYRKEIKVDYSTTFEALCRKVMTLMIKKERRLDVLCFFRSFGTQSPSWLRNFSEREEGIAPDAYSCDLGQKTNAEIVNGILRTKGICIGCVQDTVTFDMTFEKRSFGSELEVIRRIAFDALKPAKDFPTKNDEANENRFLEMFSNGKHLVIKHLGKEYRRRWRILWQKRIDFEKGDISTYAWKIRDDLFRSLFSRMISRSVFTMDDSNIGLGPREMRKDDLVCILYGCRLPVVLRRDGRSYNLIGPAYVNGAMGGELVRPQPQPRPRSYWIK